MNNLNEKEFSIVKQLLNIFASHNGEDLIGIIMKYIPKLTENEIINLVNKLDDQ